VSEDPEPAEQGMCNEISADLELSSEQKSFSFFGALMRRPEIFSARLSGKLILNCGRRVLASAMIQSLRRSIRKL
jgi:hypothetical protein